MDVRRNRDEDRLLSGHWLQLRPAGSGAAETEGRELPLDPLAAQAEAAWKKRDETVRREDGAETVSLKRATIIKVKLGVTPTPPPTATATATAPATPAMINTSTTTPLTMQISPPNDPPPAVVAHVPDMPNMKPFATKKRVEPTLF